MRLPSSRLLARLFCLAASAFCLSCHAEDGLSATQSLAWPSAVPDQSLQNLRGGFSADGLNISFGIERAIYINGALVTSTSVSGTTQGGGQAALSSDVPKTTLIQRGTGNVASVSLSSLGTVVQNSLNDQKIQSVTTINASANSLAMFGAMSLQTSLRGALIDSLKR